MFLTCQVLFLVTEQFFLNLCITGSFDEAFDKVDSLEYNNRQNCQEGKPMYAIDCHAHVYNKRLAPRAVKGVGEFYNVNMSCSGVTDELVEISKTSPIKKFIINSVAINENVVPKLNDFVAAA